MSANINAKIIVNVMPPGKRIFHSILCVSVCDLCMMLQSLYPTSSLCYKLSCNHSFPSIMESHANEYELKHLQFHSCLILSFSFFFFFSFPGSDNISSSSWLAATKHGLLRCGLHMLRRSHLLMIAFIVLQRLP